MSYVCNRKLHAPAPLRLDRENEVRVVSAGFASANAVADSEEIIIEQLLIGRLCAENSRAAVSKTDPADTLIGAVRVYIR